MFFLKCLQYIFMFKDSDFWPNFPFPGIRLFMNKNWNKRLLEKNNSDYFHHNSWQIFPWINCSWRKSSVTGLGARDIYELTSTFNVFNNEWPCNTYYYFLEICIIYTFFYAHDFFIFHKLKSTWAPLYQHSARGKDTHLPPPL